jgi:multisubunit Na+/H+ antiporter MnhB subunit
VTLVEPFDVAVVAILVWLAAWALFTGRVFRSGVLFIAFGLTMAIAWVRLGAPDIALAEAAIGAGVIGVSILHAAVQMTDREQRERPGRPDGPPVDTRTTLPSRWSRLPRRTLPSLVAAGVLGGMLVGAVWRLSDAPAGLGPLVDAHLGESGASHPVTAVLLNFRAYDTWLEIGVLLLTAVAALAVRRETDLRTATRSVGGDPLVASFTGQAVPVVILTGVLLLSVGTFGPGGAFQAGAMLGALGVLLYLAGHRAVTAIPGTTLRPWLAVGVVAFLIAAVAPLLVGDPLLRIPTGRATATILAIEVAVTASIALTLALLFVAAIPPRDPPMPPGGTERG